MSSKCNKKRIRHSDTSLVINESLGSSEKKQKQKIKLPFSFIAAGGAQQTQPFVNGPIIIVRCGGKIKMVFVRKGKSRGISTCLHCSLCHKIKRPVK